MTVCVTCNSGEQKRKELLDWFVFTMTLRCFYCVTASAYENYVRLCSFIKKKKIPNSLTEDAEPVVHGHHNHVAIRSEDAGIEHVSGAFHVGASVNKQHHWLLPAVTNICSPQRCTKRRMQRVERRKAKCQ